jgi:hypothetical protein
MKENLLMSRKGAEGFSILELTIGAMLTVLLMGVVFGLVISNQQVFVGQAGVVDMNQNVRTALDLLTTDIQSAGTGLVVPSGIGSGGCLSAIFYTDGGVGNPDTIMIVNGDTIAPTAQVKKQVAASSQFLLFPPSDVKSTDAGVTFTYSDFQNSNQAKAIFQSAGTDAFKRKYLVYDQTSAMMFDLAANAGYSVDSGVQVIQIQYNPMTNVAGKYATLIGAAVDGNVTPNYNQAMVAVLGSTIAYKLDTATRELMRTDNLVNWYTVARGIVDFQIQYRVISIPAAAIEEGVVSKPGTDTFASGLTTTRRGIRTAVITIVAETPDLKSGDKGYRQVTHRIEIASRNLNFSDNNNLSAGL